MILSYRDIAIIEKMGYDKNFFISEHNGLLQLKKIDDQCMFHKWGMMYHLSLKTGRTYTVSRGLL